MPSFRTPVNFYRPGTLQGGPVIASGENAGVMSLWGKEAGPSGRGVVIETSSQAHRLFVGTADNSITRVNMPLKYTFLGDDVDVTDVFKQAFPRGNTNFPEATMHVTIDDALGSGLPYEISGTWYLRRSTLEENPDNIDIYAESIRDNWTDSSEDTNLVGFIAKIALELPPHDELVPIPFFIEEAPANFDAFCDRVSDDIDFSATTLDVEAGEETTTASNLPIRYVTLRTYDDPRFDLHSLIATVDGDRYAIDSVSDDDVGLRTVRLQLRRIEAD